MTLAERPGRARPTAGRRHRPEGRAPAGPRRRRALRPGRAALPVLPRLGGPRPALRRPRHDPDERAPGADGLPVVEGRDPLPAHGRRGGALRRRPAPARRGRGRRWSPARCGPGRRRTTGSPASGSRTARHTPARCSSSAPRAGPADRPAGAAGRRPARDPVRRVPVVDRDRPDHRARRLGRGNAIGFRRTGHQRGVRRLPSGSHDQRRPPDDRPGRGDVARGPARPRRPGAGGDSAQGPFRAREPRTSHDAPALAEAPRVPLHRRPVIPRRTMAACCFARLAHVSQEVAATSARSRKIALLAELFRDAEADDVPIVIPYLAGRLPQGRLGVGWKVLSQPGRPGRRAHPHRARGGRPAHRARRGLRRRLAGRTRRAWSAS